MQNKYSKAFDFVFGYALDGALNDNEHCMVRNNAEIVLEIINKSFPLKPIKVPGRKKEFKYICPNDNCKKYLFEQNSQTMRLIGHLDKFNYCACCGQALDWSEE